jgi:predicted nucleic acid-binding protein
MPKSKRIVINTSPLLIIVAATNDLKILNNLYEEVIVPFEVSSEIKTGGKTNFGSSQFRAANWLCKKSNPMIISDGLRNSLDLGEAAVIQLALDKGIKIVCIDEIMGRRIARLNGLTVIGSVGILVRAKKEGYLSSIKDAILKMRNRGIWLSDRVIEVALREANEN